MSVAARYINKELLLVLVAVTAVLLSVTIGARFIAYLQDAALGKFSADGILTILYLRLPGFLQLLLPFAWSLALMLTLGRLHAESEFVVLRGGGVGPGRLLGWLAVPAIAVTAVVSYFSLYLAPDFDNQLTEFLELQRENAEFSLVTPGVFQIYYRGQRVTYAEAVSDSGDALEGVFLAEFSHGSAPPVTVRAETGGQRVDETTGARYLVLTDGHRYVGEAGSPDYQVVSFGRLQQRLEEGRVHRTPGIETISSATLLERGDAEALAELHFRLALPIVVLIGGLVSVGVGRTKPRDGRFSRLVPGLGLFVAYYAAIVFNRNAISDGQMPAVLGMWIVHAAFLLIGIRLLITSNHPARA
jgi:lipopolysaccharide export system permease protein